MKLLSSLKSYPDPVLAFIVIFTNFFKRKKKFFVSTNFFITFGAPFLCKIVTDQRLDFSGSRTKRLFIANKKNLCLTFIYFKPIS